MYKALRFTLVSLLMMLCGTAFAEDVTLAAGTNGSACTVNNQDGIKVGKSSAGGDMTITVPANTVKLTLHAAAWKGVQDLSVSITGATADPESITLTPDVGISNNSPFTLAGNEDDFKFEIALSDVATETTLTLAANKRFVVWGASAVVSTGGGDEPQTQTFTATFENDGNWAEVHAYAWTTTGEGNDAVTKEFLGAWPGTKIESTDDGYVLSFEATEAPEKIIFNNGAEVQTANLDFEDGATYNSKGKVVPEPVEQTFTATFTTIADWTDVYAYAWTGDGDAATKFLGDWPGTKLEAADGVYTVTINATAAPEKIIFNNGDKEQTADLAFENEKAYKYIPTGTAEKPLTIAQAIAAIDAGISTTETVFVEGIISKIESYTSGAITYWISTDGTTDGQQFQVYKGKNIDGADFASKGDIEVGAKVIVKGSIKLYKETTYEFDQNNQLVKYEAPAPVAKTYTASFTTNKEWAEVYAYTWTDGEPKVEQLSAWPGTKMTKNEETGIFSISFEATGKPANIIFHNGAGEQTADLAFEDAKKYVYIASSADAPLTVAQAVAAIDAGIDVTSEVFVEGIVSQIDSYSSGAITYWISTDGTTDNQFEVYKGKNIDGADFASADDIKVGAKVVVKGGIKKYKEIYEFDQNNQLVKYEAPIVLNTYTATFTNAADWEEVWAYTWTGAGDTKVEQLGVWRGTQLTADANGKFTVTIEATEAPAFIIFHNGKDGEAKAQTIDLLFENEGSYTNAIPERVVADGQYYIKNPAKNLFIPEDCQLLAAEGFAFTFTFDEKVGAYAITGHDFFADGDKKWYVEGDATSCKIYYYAEGVKKYLDISNRNGLRVNDGKTEAEPLVDANYTWQLVEKAAPQPVTITSMAIVGDFIGGTATEEEAEPWWNPANGWQMTQDAENPAIWTLTKEFEAEAKKYEYKATANGNWTDYVLPKEGNYDYNFDTAGKYNLTFTADTENHTLTLDVQKAEEPANLPSVTYALSEGDTFTSGQTVEVKNDEEIVVATITYGEAGGADFKAAAADNHVEGFTAFTEGNGTNGNKAGGTFYTIVPKYDGKIDAAVILNGDKAFYVEENGTALEAYNGIKVTEKYYGIYTFDVKANKSYKFYCAGSKLGFYGFKYEYEMTAPEEPVVIENMYLVGDFTGGWPTQDAETQVWDWSMAKEMTKSTDPEKANIWTYEIKGFEAEAKTYEYKVSANKNWDGYKLPDNGNANFNFNTADYGAGKYDLLFTVDTKENTVELVATKVEEPQPEPNTYTATFDNAGNWEKVYAYAWSGEDPNVTEFLGAWPGTELAAPADGTTAYTVTIKAEAAPAFIIFNNGQKGEGNQTDDLAFENGKAYEYAAPIKHTWDFTQWSEATVRNLKADAAASKLEGWSDVEKKADAEADVDPTEASKDNCFWATVTPDENGELAANGVTIAELKGLSFNPTYATARSLAIAVNYPVALSTYAGPAYLWLGGGGKNVDCFVIKNVKAGTTIKMGVESHKYDDGRGVQLFIDNAGARGAKLMGTDGNEVAVPKTYEDQEWVVAGEEGEVVNVIVYNTKGCHIYYIDAEIGKAPEPVVPDVYTVAGAFGDRIDAGADDVIFGKAWDVEAEDNQLVEGEDGVYTLTKTGIELTPGTIYYKVVKNNSWDVNWGFNGANAEYVINDAGVYTITFKFNPTSTLDNGFNLTCEVEKTGEPTGIASIKAAQLEGAAIYTLQGVRVNNVKKGGMYIVNGRKVAVK